MMTPNIYYFHERKPTEGELRAWSDLRAQRGQPRVVPFENTKHHRGPVAVKATTKNFSPKPTLESEKLSRTWVIGRLTSFLLAGARWTHNAVAMCPI